jgi:hypothetical protein
MTGGDRRGTPVMGVARAAFAPTAQAHRQRVPAQGEPQHDRAGQYFGEDARDHEPEDQQEGAADGQGEEDHAAHHQTAGGLHDLVLHALTGQEAVDGDGRDE